jgi:glycosyltransferase involved in cell wall biosynthesis
VKQQNKIAIITPVYNDWPSCNRLVEELDTVAGQLVEHTVDIIIVDDGSTQKSQIGLVKNRDFEHINCICITELASNLGHQRAIAAGLYIAVDRNAYDSIIIMDSDGEDKPSDIPRLIKEQQSHPDSIIVAERSKRSEGLAFRFFYWIYKAIYRLLTGSEINFGNFSAISNEAARRLLHMPELWNNFPSALLRSRLPHRNIETSRGKRYFGDSKMNFSGLVIHGLSAISVNSEIVFARVMFLCFFLALLTGLGGVFVIGVRLCTDLAIPGWASDVIGSLAIVFTQIVFFFFTSMFLLLHARSNPANSPSEVIPGYIAVSGEVYKNARTDI